MHQGNGMALAGSDIAPYARRRKVSQRRTHLFGFIRRARELAAGALVVVLVGALLFAGPAVGGQSGLSRKAKIKAAPEYPDLARRSHITGTVRILVVVAPDGSIRDSKVLGGHPVLVNAAMEALKKWKFEPANEETSGTVEFKFVAQ